MKEGFTLVEILITLSIIFILSGILLPNYKKFQGQFSLLRSGYKLAKDLIVAQEMATSATEIGGGVPPGYGVYLEKGNEYYLIYADVQGNERYDEGDQVLERIYFEKKVYIQDVYPPSLSVNFKGPSPNTKISDDLNSVTIILALKNDPQSKKEVFVNKAGLIYVK